MVTYVVDLKKLMKITARFLHRYDVPEHFSKSKNEQYSLHQMLALYVLFCLCDVGIDRFGELVKILDPALFRFKKAPHFTTMWRTWRRFQPRFLRGLVRRSGRGGRDKCVALDPIHFEITRPSQSYCRRTKRNPLQEPNRKTTIATGTRSLRILDAYMAKDSHRNGLNDMAKVAGPWMKNKTIVADTEFDAEERFHQAIITFGAEALLHCVIKRFLSGGQKGRDARSYVDSGLAEAITEGHWQKPSTA